MRRLVRGVARALLVCAVCLGILAVRGEAQPAVSSDVHFQTEGPVSGPPAPRLTGSDYPLPPLPYPFNESRVVIWALAQQHLYFGAFILGALLLVTLSEGWAMATRHRERAHWARRAARGQPHQRQHARVLAGARRPRLD